MRGVASHVVDCVVEACIVRERRLRTPIPGGFENLVQGRIIHSVSRRGKYLLFALGDGHVLIHLGMSGSLRLTTPGMVAGRHDHVDWCLSNGKVLRFRDPRRFGTVTWIEGDPMGHVLLSALGPEPLAEGFSTDYLYGRSRHKKTPVKSFIMDSHVVVGIGNIYANEALFEAGIHPLREAGRISIGRYGRLVSAIKSVLGRAIMQGGTTLRDFVGGDGQPGYFSQSLSAYGRGGEPCVTCGTTLRETRLAQRTTVYCVRCQR